MDKRPIDKIGAFNHTLAAKRAEWGLNLNLELRFFEKDFPGARQHFDGAGNAVAGFYVDVLLVEGKGICLRYIKLIPLMLVRINNFSVVAFKLPFSTARRWIENNQPIFILTRKQLGVFVEKILKFGETTINRFA